MNQQSPISMKISDFAANESVPLLFGSTRIVRGIAALDVRRWLHPSLAEKQTYRDCSEDSHAYSQTEPAILLQKAIYKHHAKRTEIKATKPKAK